jgi:hypothetical protein
VTSRVMFRALEPRRCSIDFSRLTCTEARRRVVQLVRAGLPPETVACYFGWSRPDVWRALGEPDDDDA